MPNADDFEVINRPKSEDAKEGSATSRPPPPPPQPLNQHPLRCVPQGAAIGAIAAAFVVQNGEEGLGSDSEDSFSSDNSICTYCCVNVPFHIRRGSTPGEIGGNEMVNAADDAMDTVLAQRLARAQKLLL